MDKPGNPTGAKLVVLQVMPTKTDQRNRLMMRKIFRVGEPGKELAPGRAIVDMMRGDRVEVDPRRVLLFRHPKNGGEVSKGCFGRWCKEALVRVGLDDLATGGHGFRISGCTAMTELAGLDTAVASI